MHLEHGAGAGYIIGERLPDAREGGLETDAVGPPGDGEPIQSDRFVLGHKARLNS